MEEVSLKTGITPKKLETILAFVLTSLFLSIAILFEFYYYASTRTPLKNIEVVPNGKSSVIINVVSTVPVKTKIEYGTSTLYLTSTPEDVDYNVEHKDLVWGLLPDKTHYFRVVAQDQNGKQYASNFYQY